MSLLNLNAYSRMNSNSFSRSAPLSHHSQILTSRHAFHPLSKTVNVRACSHEIHLPKLTGPRRRSISCSPVALADGRANPPAGRWFIGQLTTPTVVLEVLSLGEGLRPSVRTLREFSSLGVSAGPGRKSRLAPPSLSPFGRITVRE